MSFKTVINSSQFIVASVSPVGKWSIAPVPRIHFSYQDALSESKRLASQNSGYKFVVLAVSAVSKVRPVNDPIEVTYRV